MQEIKLRAWITGAVKPFMAKFGRKETSITNLVCDADGIETIYVNTEHYNRGEFSLMQYTGLKDKNGKEIYDGDIVEYHQPYVTESTPDSPPEGDEFETNGQIVFNEEDGSWLIQSNKIIYPTGLDIFGSDAKYRANLYWLIDEETSNCGETFVKVVGNIYENPELLERK